MTGRYNLCDNRLTLGYWFNGAYVVISGRDIDANRLDFAKELGADRVIDVTKEDIILYEIREITNGRGADVVLKCSGVGVATLTGIEAVKKQGQFVQIGLAGKPSVVRPTLLYIWRSWPKCAPPERSRRKSLDFGCDFPDSL